MGLVEELEELALATRLRRLADRLQQDVSRVYDEQELAVRARWFPILVALDRKSPRSISELARELGLTHTAINQIAAEMGRRRLLVSEKHADDARRRLLRLSPAGAKVVRQLEPLWQEILTATRALARESGHNLIEAIAAVEARLDEVPMHERLRDRLAARMLTIIDYRPELAHHFRALNLAWLEAMFTVAEEDHVILDDPGGQVIEPGGAILFAALGDEIVGTCALVRRTPTVLELAKMAVAESHRGCGIGRHLARAAVERAARLGARTLVLLTSPRLVAAVALYRSLGFRDVAELDVPHASYPRCSIAMELDIPPREATRRQK